MDHLTWRLVAILGALISTSALTGASLYEESVLDTVWPHKPDIVRPTVGGANRKRFWIPADLVAIVSLLAAAWAAWPVTDARVAVLVGVVFYAINVGVSVAYFVPELLRVERVGTQPDAPSSRTWVRRNRWRGAIFVCTNVALVSRLPRWLVLTNDTYCLKREAKKRKMIRAGLRRADALI